MMYISSDHLDACMIQICMMYNYISMIPILDPGTYMYVCMKRIAVIQFKFHRPTNQQTRRF